MPLTAVITITAGAGIRAFEKRRFDFKPLGTVRTAIPIAGIAIPSAAALLMEFPGCSSMQPANTADIELILEKTHS